MSVFGCVYIVCGHSSVIGRLECWSEVVGPVLCGQEAIETAEQDTVLDVDIHSKLHVLYGGTKVVQHTPPSKTGPGLKGTEQYSCSSS